MKTSCLKCKGRGKVDYALIPPFNPNYIGTHLPPIPPLKERRTCNACAGRGWVWSAL